MKLDLEKFKPLGSFVLVKRDSDYETTETGLTVPIGSRSRFRKGVVVSAGLGKFAPSGDWIDNLVVKGDEIIYDSLAGIELEFNGEKYLLLESELHVVGLVWDREKQGFR